LLLLLLLLLLGSPKPHLKLSTDPNVNGGHTVLYRFRGRKSLP
jgi:hypothetical protein